MEHDPIEDDPKYQSIFASIDAEVETLLAEDGYTRKGIGMGYCHMFWPAKAKVLKEKYNIDWKSPAEMNQGVLFD